MDADRREAGTSATSKKTKRKQKDLPRGSMGEYGVGKGILGKYGGGSVGRGSYGGGGHGDADSGEVGTNAMAKKTQKLLMGLTKMLGGEMSASEGGGSEGGSGS